MNEPNPNPNAPCALKALRCAHCKRLSDELETFVVLSTDAHGITIRLWEHRIDAAGTVLCLLGCLGRDGNAALSLFSEAYKPKPKPPTQPEVLNDDLRLAADAV